MPPQIWRVGSVSFDEATRELRVAGTRRAIENKPLALFLCLMRAAPSKVTKTKLMAAGWGQGSISDQSLVVAISKLRRAFSDDEPDLIEVIPNEGYRLTKPVTISLSEPPPKPIFAFAVNEPVPGRSSWRFAAPLGAGRANNVWLATHVTTGERRVFKFADDPEHIAALCHEVKLSVLLREIPDSAEFFVPVLDSDLASLPARIESADGGLDLVAWAEQQGGLAAIPIQTRLALVADAAEALARAHAIGVLHGDLQPGNILIQGDVSSPKLLLADFGAGGLTEAARADLLSRSLQTLSFDAGTQQRGALLYVPLEARFDGRPTIPADIYALGILLYHMTVGEFRRPLTPQWKDSVADAMLREDILAAAADNPEDRLKSADELAKRLRTLGERRTLQELSERKQAAELRLKRLRPIWRASTAAGLITLIATSLAAWQGFRARDEAVRRATIEASVNRFLTEDLLSRGDPAVAGKPGETLVEAAQAAEPMIDQRFSTEPLLAASLYVVLTKVFESSAAFDASRHAFERAESILTRSVGSNSADVTILLLRRAAMEIIASQPGSLETGKNLIKRVAPRVANLGPRARETQAWLLFAKGQLQILEGNMAEAYAEFAEAITIADTMPGAFDSATYFTMRDQEGFSLLKMGRSDEANAIFADLVAQQTELHGPLHPDTLRASLRLAETTIMSGDPKLAVLRFDALIPRLRLVFGTTSRKVVIALSARGDALLMLGRYAESERDATEGYESSLATLGKNAYSTFTLYERAGEAECRDGRTNDGLKKMQDAYATSQATLGNAHPITQSFRPDIALCLTLAGRALEARAIIANLDCAELAGFLAEPDFCANMNVQRAAIAKATGDVEKTRALLLAALANYGTNPSDPFYKNFAETMLASLPTATSK